MTAAPDGVSGSQVDLASEGQSLLLYFDSQSISFEWKETRTTGHLRTYWSYSTQTRAEEPKLPRTCVFFSLENKLSTCPENVQHITSFREHRGPYSYMFTRMYVCVCVCLNNN